ncbi:hypothetical protein DXG03_004242 [Asterophora parasitica]|uniref:Uncharacterized protein n=1 Tax=Asterophora parasitica TaxID=117018 RepID=A0A9P7GCI2_9AGAR|nr:hypothetical protein DXG03_004242 [Asterophora parasitica]
MAPHPILKRASRPGPPLAVHFPPSPSLTTHTFTAYSSSYYDRSPIVVDANSCAMPERGCPGRTYTLDEPAPPSPSPNRRHLSCSGRDLHPRALAARASASTSHLLPPLIPDLSSESDESDGFASPFLPSFTPTNTTTHIHGLAIPTERYSPSPSYDFDVDPYAAPPVSPNVLSFLPHAPYSPYAHQYHETFVPDDPPTPKPRRRRERKHDPSRSPDRIPDAPPASPSSKRAAALTKSLAARHAVSAFRIEDDGCLGGF